MSKPRTYIVRAIDTVNPFTCLGAAKDLAGFVEITDVPTEAKAIELLLTHPTVSKMVTALPPLTSQSYVDVVNVKADVNVSSASEAKQVRKDLFTAIQSWAEKSRVKGARGWRAHALKTPKVAARKDGSGYELDFDAIFGHAVFYTDSVSSVGHTDDSAFLAETFADLKKHLKRTYPGLVDNISYTQEAAGIAATV
jgi:hypothetical protein